MDRIQAPWLSTRGRFVAGILFAALVAGPVVVPDAPAAATPGPDLVVLVRHAEKAEAPASDPPLSPQGTERALELARVLADAGITRIHSSDTRRARDTAAPLAAALGLEIELYDPRDLPAMASRLRSLPGRHLVVGHSNTTDVLSGAMGGETFGEIVETWEYDRLYVLTPRGEGGDFGTVLMRFGARATPR
jgi:2,3-bisphosphoglycerate-dependent phosphoglycerate mutase